ncbi:AAA family ATPase [Weissella ceti]|uniref:AAA family ATPase n=1 Tax=Weissella ceti TaxID=759620 RepID=A0ABT3E231_9LACO|nr:UvrD-helicase domain-containing protein [Weissella ceti]MCW0952482.1 AAA family ATPase [Weissella ceti]QVK11848.1 AAA family ATPase [Weissella ceti]
MTTKKIILAKAGAGKTRYVTQSNEFIGKRILYTTFTNENIKNITFLVQDSSHKSENVYIQTYHSMLINNFIRPYINDINSCFTENINLSNGISWVSEQEIGEKRFAKKQNIDFWTNSNGQIYGNRVSRLILDNKFVFEKGLQRLRKYFDVIIVDEFQDFTNYDFSFLRELIQKSKMDIVYVGDVYQSLVTTTSTTVTPYKNDYSSDVFFIKKQFETEPFNIQVDGELFLDSKRITENVAEFVKEKLGINITSNKKNSGYVHFIDDFADDVLEKVESILIFDRKTIVPEKYRNKTYNWTISKGSTFENVAIILTPTTYDKLLVDASKELSISTRNKLYVALTRSKSDVYLISPDCWKFFISDDWERPAKQLALDF